VGVVSKGRKGGVIVRKWTPNTLQMLADFSVDCAAGRKGLSGRIVHGKPNEGKLHVRIDEGSPETGGQVTTALVTYSTIW
jgi:hypothetical protein